MTVSRRKILRVSLVGGALLAAGGALAFVRTRGYAVDPERADKLLALTPWQLVVVEHAARRIAARDDESDKGPPSADACDVAGFVDAYVARMPDGPRRDLGRFLAYLEHLAPLRARTGSRFTRLDAAAQDRVLGALEAGDDPLLRAGFEGLKALVFMGYYRDPRTWSVLGYEGPIVGRPAKGWWR